MGQAPMFEEPTLTVAELSTSIGRALTRAFPDEVWVRGEIANLSRRAQAVYFDLVDGDCTLPVVLWDNDRRVVNNILTRAGGAVRMTDGTDVRIRARVSWFARRGTVSLRMLSIDPAYTLGQLAEARERLLAALREDGTLTRNTTRELSPVPLRIGLVTSSGSAAAADFLQTLETSGRAFSVLQVDTRVQGVDAVASIVAGLKTLAGRADALDVVCLVRGGGARTDLAAFDDEAVARAIAAMPLPVFTGIGHEIDTTVVDHAAHTAFKTPTACAAALVERVQLFVDRCTWCATRIGRAAVHATERARTTTDAAAGRVGGAARHHLRSHGARVDRAADALARRAPRALDEAARRLDAADARRRAADPARALARGWTLTRDRHGHLVTRAAAAPIGSELHTTFADGTVASTVTAADLDSAPAAPDSGAGDG
jgi:exodeoxyribonuclease VII large subunit